MALFAGGEGAIRAASVEAALRIWMSSSPLRGCSQYALGELGDEVRYENRFTDVAVCGVSVSSRSSEEAPTSPCQPPARASGLDRTPHATPPRTSHFSRSPDSALAVMAMMMGRSLAAKRRHSSRVASRPFMPVLAVR
jgi:hypothetical protein